MSKVTTLLQLETTVLNVFFEMHDDLLNEVIETQGECYTTTVLRDSEV